jgi:hypothetical protein
VRNDDKIQRWVFVKNGNESWRIAIKLNILIDAVDVFIKVADNRQAESEWQKAETALKSACIVVLIACFVSC